MRAALVLLVAYAVALVHVSAFSMKGGLRNGLKLHMRMSEGGEDGGQTRMMSWPFQMFKAPSYLDGSLAGDAGFDPLGIASKETLFNLRECEIKNARIAMLASVGWPAAELSHRIIADRLRLPELLGDNDRVPSVLNGGLNNNYALFALGLTFAVGGVLELELVRRRQKTPEILDGFFDMFNEDGWDTPGKYVMKMIFCIFRELLLYTAVASLESPDLLLPYSMKD